MSGWVKLHRQVLDNQDLMHDDTAYILFTKLLLVANPKGEVGKSGRELAMLFNMKYPTLYKALQRLESYQMVKQSSKHSYSLIRICKWSDFQSSGKQSSKHTVSTREAHGKQITGAVRIENKNKEIGNVKKEDFRGQESPAKERIRSMLNERGILKTI